MSNLIRNIFLFPVLCLLAVSCNINKDLVTDCDCNCNKDAKANALYEKWIQAELKCMIMARPECSYNYPVMPGMDEWAQFTTTQAMVDASQVPEAVLTCQSTQAIMEALWEYPFFEEITSRYNHYQHDFEAIYSNNGAYKVFVIKKDAAQSILTRLLLVDPLFPILPHGLELFLAQPVFLKQLNNDDKKKAVTVVFKNDSLSQIANGYGQDVMRQVTWLLIGRTMFYANYKPFVDLVNSNTQLKGFLDTSVINVYTLEEYNRFFQLIISNGQAFIK